MVVVLMDRVTGVLPGIAGVSKVLSTILRKGLLSRGLSALIENATVFSLLTTGLSVNEFATFFSTACYGQAPFIANEAGIGYEGILRFSITSSNLSKKVLTTSCQVHHRLKYASGEYYQIYPDAHPSQIDKC